MKYDLIVIGGGGAGLASACEALKYSPSSKVLVISEEKRVAYPRCDLPYLLFSGKLPSDAGYSRIKNLEILKGETAKGIDIKNKKVRCSSGEFEYNSLVIATGSRVFIPPIPGVESEGVLPFRTLEDFNKLKELLSSAEKIVIVGAGAVGLELSENLSEKDYEVTIVEMFSQVLPRALDKDMALPIAKLMTERGITLRLGERVEKIKAEDGRVKSVALGKEEISADVVILATGVRPNVELAKNAGIEIGKTGGIKTNPRMETNIKNVFAAGDCAENIHFLTKEPYLGLLGSSAYKQGKVAGINAVGGNLSYEGVINPLILKIFDLEIGSVGLNEEEARKRYGECIITKATTDEKALFNDGFTTVKLIATKEGRIVGCQMIGKRIPPKIDMLSIAIKKGVTVEELMLHETSYAPILTVQISAVTLAADVAWKRIIRRRR